MMLTASAEGTSRRCARIGCGATLPRVVPAGWNGGGVVWKLLVGNHWLYRVDLNPPRWRRSEHNRSFEGKHYRNEWETPRTESARLLPAIVECPQCRCVQRIEPAG